MTFQGVKHFYYLYSNLNLIGKLYICFRNIILLHKVVTFFCLSQRISITPEPIMFSFTVKLLIGLGKVLNYFWGGCLQPPSPKKIFIFIF